MDYLSSKNIHKKLTGWGFRPRRLEKFAKKHGFKGLSYSTCRRMLMANMGEYNWEERTLAAFTSLIQYIEERQEAEGVKK